MSASRPQISPGLFSPLFLDSLPPPPLCVGDSALSLFSPPTPIITVRVLSLHVPLFAVSLLPSLSPEAQDVLQIGCISLGAHRHLRLDKGKTKLSPFLPLQYQQVPLVVSRLLVLLSFSHPKKNKQTGNHPVIFCALINPVTTSRIHSVPYHPSAQLPWLRH